MNETIKTQLNHRTIRAFDKTLTKEEVDLLVKAKNSFKYVLQPIRLLVHFGSSIEEGISSCEWATLCR